MLLTPLIRIQSEPEKDSTGLEKAPSLSGVASVSTTDKDKIFLIDLETKYTANDGNSLTEGVELLKWLRVKGINNHVVLTSFMPITYWLKKDTKNAIVGSKGTTFLQLPNEKLINNYEYVFNKDENCKEIPPEPANPEDLKAIFRIEFDFKKIRHDEANYFGLRQLIKNHKYIESNYDPMYTVAVNDLSHEILEYSYKNNNINKFIPNKNYLIKNLNSIRETKWNVIYVDDKANIGWTNFLKTIIGEKSDFIEIIPEESDNDVTICQKIDTKLNELKIKSLKDVNLYISDLKLKNSEINFKDYTKLLSYETIKSLRDKTDNRFRVMYFTASNDLSKMRGLLNLKKYNPHLIYTKQGADQMLTEEESFDNYKELISSLSSVLRSNQPKQMVENLQIVNLIEENLKQELAEQYKEIVTNSLLPMLEIDFSRFDKIYIDTNIFLRVDLSSDLLRLIVHYKEKICIPVTVNYELFNISNDNDYKKPLESISASFFYKVIKDLELNLDNSELLNSDIDIIKNKEQHPKDFADKHIVRILTKSTENVLLLCNDNGVIRNVANENKNNVFISKSINSVPKQSSYYKEKAFAPKNLKAQENTPLEKVNFVLNNNEVYIKEIVEFRNNICVLKLSNDRIVTFSYANNLIDKKIIDSIFHSKGKWLINLPCSNRMLTDFNPNTKSRDGNYKILINEFNSRIKKYIV